MLTVRLILGTVFFLTPIAYTFLRLAGLIGPEDKDEAVILGIVLWVVGILLGFAFLASESIVK